MLALSNAEKSAKESQTQLDHLTAANKKLHADYADLQEKSASIEKEKFELREQLEAAQQVRFFPSFVWLSGPKSTTARELTT